MAKGVKTRITVEDRAHAKMRKASQDVSRLGKTWRRTARITRRATRVMGRGMRSLSKMMTGLMRKAKFMMIGLQVTATIMGGMMVRSALKYERALRNVTSLMAGAGMGQAEIEKNFRRMDSSIRRMAVGMGQAPEDLAKGMYNVVSATFDGSSALQVLEWSAKGALAGLSDTETVTGLMTKTLQAYRKEGDTNADVAAKSADTMDTFFMAVNRGMFTFDDLATKLGALPATANAFGVSLDDLMGFLSTATVRGVGLDEAIVGVRQSLIQIAKTTPATAKAAEELFGKDWKDWWSAKGLATSGLFGTLTKLQEFLPDISQSVMEAAVAISDDGGDAMSFLAEQTGASVDALAALFPNIRALKAILAVSGPGMTLYAENMGYMEERAGATDRALVEMEKSGSLAMAKFKSMISVIGLDVGGLVLPALTSFGKHAVSWYGGIQAEFAQQGGLFDNDDWMEGIPDSQAEEQMKIAAQNFWDAASPGDRLMFTIKSAQQEIANWWGSPEVQTKVDEWAENIQKAVKGALGTAFDWLKKELIAWATQIPKRMAATVTEGLSSEEGMRAQDWAMVAAGFLVISKIGTVGAKILTAVGIMGGGAAAAGGGAAAAAGGTAAAAAGGAATLSFGTVVLTAVAAGALSYTFAKFIDSKIDWRNQGLNAEGTARAWVVREMDRAKIDAFYGAGTPEAAAAQQRYSTAMAPSPGTTVTGAYGMQGPQFPSGAGLNWSDPFGGKVWDEASGGFIEAAKTQDSAADKAKAAAQRQRFAAFKFDGGVGTFGQWVAKLPGTLPHETTGGEGFPGGQHGAARGFSGMVYSPKSFTVGEGQRPEHVEIKPFGGRSGGGGTTVGPVTITVTEAGDAKQTAAYVVRELEKAMSNG